MCFPDENRRKKNQKRTFLAFNIRKNLTKQRNTDEMKISKFCLRILIHSMCTRQVQMNLFEFFLTQKVNEEGWEAKTKQRLIYCTESKMKEFDEHIVDSLLEGGQGQSQMDR
jgi:hypothetical protein